MSTLDAIKKLSETHDNVVFEMLDDTDMVIPDYPLLSSVWKGLQTVCVPDKIGQYISVVVIETGGNGSAAGIIVHPHDDPPPLLLLSTTEIKPDSTPHSLYLMLITELAENFMHLISDKMNHRL